MRLLLDTHALIWSAEPADNHRLSPVARTAIEDRANELTVSAASAWEISTKHRLGRLPEGERIVRRWDDIVSELGATELPITARHGLLAGTFEAVNQDPFDRMLAAQAITVGAQLVTIDRAMDGFGVDILW